MTSFMVVQVCFSASSACELASLAMLGAICLAPAGCLALSPYPVSGLVAAAIVFPFMAWANNVECLQPYAGGGAAMAYVAVFLYGVPASAIGGLATLLVVAWRRRAAA